ncbi:2-oxoglutarate dehydrogenase E1 component [Sporosarcina thermotolerans]|uniref:2-oxoglutarate dehydrogenase E1 component n=1 Tax=Sporosarcina thermotolerans TaxID=633404 RepID=A0AAW9A6S2_9BACL|nr:2-oxoglutarate dehydrogenase E1 component [Sporosarcina thermotolerans]MDW0115435.1 2-oxoglutarate dehydrogenase E1 component [Sporosarcina thermotolerans]
MSNNVGTQRSPYSIFTGPNLGYVMEMYEQFKMSPESVDPELAEMFRSFGAPSVDEAEQTQSMAATAVPAVNFGKVLAAYTLIDAIRAYGHLASDIYPLNDRPKDSTRLELSYYGLTESDLLSMPASLFLKTPPTNVENGMDAVNYLKSLYTGKIAYEFAHVIDEEERSWIQTRIENGEVSINLSNEDKKAMLERLTKIEGFEKFIHRTFVGAKRFSIEGLDSLVILLDELVRRSESQRMKKVLIGMAHRGRLNVLTHILNKPYEMMFAEFAGVPSDPFIPEDGTLKTTRGWFGDVKYHMGALYKAPSGTERFLAYNPSHLEVVNPVVNGQTRAAQETTNHAGAPEQDMKAAYSIIIHGDAAFPGQGIVPETFNYSRVRGYKTGGSIHIIANNTIGFTTEYYDSRSTHYSSDPAKGFEVPIVHVNADSPEDVMVVAAFAFEYRQKFGKDILIDLIGYRRYGHNEMDEPLVTNPMMYHQIHKHPTARQLYGTELVNSGIISDTDVEKLDADIFAMMQSAYDKVKENKSDVKKLSDATPDYVMAGYPENLETGVEQERLERMNEELLTYPEDFTVFGKLDRILKRREEPFKGKGKIDWAHAEQLAFGSILQDGKPIRITGQDVQRGTFAHRHLVLHDEKTGEELVPLHHISGSNASFVAYNSPLTEFAVVGYEFGYNLEKDQALSIWEAQYGDFANMAQVMFDQFISSSHSKWGQQSGMVILLPHAYEGQGPEHSSARLERYLQLCAENNWTVANISSAANYFHVLRRQAKMLGTEVERPLVIVSPKSLLRHPLVGADPSDLANGHFQTVLEQPGTGQEPKKVKKVLFASGKMAIDLAEAVKDGEGFEHLHIVRVEQLYPFPSEKIADIVARFPNVEELVWVQEEPKNMGSWSFALPYLQEIAEEKKVSYAGRIHRASPSEGSGDAHKIAQQRIIDEALKK